MRERPIVVTLPPEDYHRLEEMGRAEERDPFQQACWLLKRALRRDATESRPALADRCEHVECAVA